MTNPTNGNDQNKQIQMEGNDLAEKRRKDQAS
jgi:hypothetical protein